MRALHRHLTVCISWLGSQVSGNDRWRVSQWLRYRFVTSRKIHRAVTAVKLRQFCGWLWQWRFPVQQWKWINFTPPESTKCLMHTRATCSAHLNSWLVNALVKCVLMAILILNSL